MPTETAMLTRGEVARILGCSRRRIAQFEEAGRLRAIVDGKGVHHFARADVLAFAKNRVVHADKVAGTIAADVFRLFREGVELPEIVMQTQQSPATIRSLWEEFRRPLEAPASPAIPRDLVALMSLSGGGAKIKPQNGGTL
jgi:hypothetical protein